MQTQYFSGLLCRRHTRGKVADMADEDFRAAFRVPREWWDAWGRVCERLGTNRTARIHELVARDIAEHGDDADQAAFAAGQDEATLRQARRHIGRPPRPRPVGTGAAAADYRTVLERAMTLARQTYPNVSPQLRAAFANSVAYAVTGKSGGYGGPSVREHVACQAMRPGMTFEAAAEELSRPDGLIFGPLTEQHRQVWDDEPHFDDDPADAESMNRPPA